MKAIRKVAPRPDALEILETPVPVCGPADVLLKVRAASLCGTDGHIYNWGPSIAPKLMAATDDFSRPITIGHEFCGEVVEVGSAVRGVGTGAAEPIRVGDFVSAESHIICGRCYQCSRGEYHVCTNETIIGVHRDGGFAEYICIPAACAWRNDPAVVPVEVACVEEPFGNAVHAATKFDPRDRCVLVVGVGPIGLFSIIVAAAEGAARIIAVDTSPYRLELASQVGAHAALRTGSASGEDPAARGRERERMVGLIRDAALPLEVDLAMEMSGHPDAIDTALRAVRRGGKMVLFGLPKGNAVTLERYSEDIIFGGLTLQGIIGRRLYGTWEKTRELTSRADVRDKICTVITHRYPFENFQEAFQRMIGRESGKVILNVAAS